MAEPYRVTILVVGDLGRSPRMLNHALALAQHGAEVALVGYRDAPIDPCVTDNPHICIFRLPSSKRAPREAGRLRFLVESGLRFAWLHVQLLWMLLARTPRPDAVLVQNPPAIPTLLAGWIASRLRRSKFLIDWHNLSDSMLALRLGADHWLVHFVHAWERTLGRRADAHFCVSNAMRAYLSNICGLNHPVVLYDAPRERSEPLPMHQRLPMAADLLKPYNIDLPGNARLLVAPTSWTVDEDLDMLLDALVQWDSSSSVSETRLIVLITGRGHLRAPFEERLNRVALRRAEVHLLFFEPAAYRRLLSVATLGLSMHRSSSGLDLPIKLMDFFGAGTPVCAFDYGPCLRERLEPGSTGVTFRDSPELARRLADLLEADPTVLEQMKRNIARMPLETWFESWTRVAASQFE